ncbi:MAG: ABC transporter ATP-binding protein, partial [Myxococcota bacterium]
GSCKSTLIRAACGVLPYTEGRIRIGDDDLTSLTRRLRAQRIAVVPQESQFAFPFSVLEVVLMGRHPHLSGLAFESTRDTELAHAALARLSASHLAERNIQDLSSGERQRVIFARALVQEPRLLLLDEPASFLDLRHQVALYEEVRALARRDGVGVLTVLHDLNLAAEYCERSYLLKGGRVVAAGVTSEVFTYQNLTHVFDTDLYVDINALTGKLIVVPLPRR